MGIQYYQFKSHYGIPLLLSKIEEQKYIKELSLFVVQIRDSSLFMTEKTDVGAINV